MAAHKNIHTILKNAPFNLFCIISVFVCLFNLVYYGCFLWLHTDNAVKIDTLLT